MANPLKCVVVTPEKAVLDEEATFIVVPMIDGELGVAEDRLPLIGRLGFGELRISKGNDIKHYYVDGGFVQVRGNVVSVLTAKAIPAKDINIAQAEEVLRSAQDRSHAGRPGSTGKGPATCSRSAADRSAIRVKTDFSAQSANPPRSATLSTNSPFSRQ